MPLKVLEWIKCLDLAQQALLIIFSQTTTTRLSKELPACIWPDTHCQTQQNKTLLAVLKTPLTTNVTQILGPFADVLSRVASRLYNTTACGLLPVTGCCCLHLHRLLLLPLHFPLCPLFLHQLHHSLHRSAAGGWPSLPSSSPSAPSAPG